MTTRAAVVGLGWAGARHAAIYARRSDVKLVAVVDRDAALAAAVGFELGAAAFPSVDAMAERMPHDIEVDVVTVAVPNAAHLDVTSVALEAGCDVFVEKPVTAASAEARLLEERAHERGSIVAVGHVERYNPAVVLAAAIAGAAGGVVHMQACRIGPLPMRARGSGIVLESAIHDLDIAAELCGPEVRVVAASVFGDGGDPVSCTAVLQGRAADASIHAGWRTATKQRTLRLISPGAVVSADLVRLEVWVEADDDSWRAHVSVPSDATVDRLDGRRLVRVRLPRFDQFDAEQSDFLEAVRCRRAPMVDLPAGRRAVELAEGVLAFGSGGSQQ